MQIVHRILPVAGAVLIGCGGASDPVENGAPTWHQDVAPIVVGRCSGCHDNGGIAPFSLQTYDDARTFAEPMLDAVEAGTMPPFLAQETEACMPRLPWKHDLRLSDDERATLRTWVEADMPEGDPSAAMQTAPPEAQLLEREDIVIRLPEPITVDGVADMHTCLIVDPGLTEDRFITGRLMTAGNASVLHHVVSYIVEPGFNDDETERTKTQLEAALQAERGVGIGDRYDCFGGPGLETVATELVDAWAPGALPNLAPEGSGQPIDKDALILLDIHYHPTGLGPEIDTDTQLALMLADSPPEKISQIVLLGNFNERFESEFGIGDRVTPTGETFLIPAGDAAHVEEMTWEWILPLGLELAVYEAGTHMHYVGRDMQIHLERTSPLPGEPAEECLIQTPAWDFNWQRGYIYDAPQADLPIMRNGDVLHMRCTYDNSMGNPFLLDALGEQGLQSPIDVGLGEDTLDEMCLAAVGIVYTNFQ